MAKITKGKLEGMNAVADNRGVIRAAAMDQRGSLKKALAREMGKQPDEVAFEQMSEFKSSVIKVLSPHASGVLLDPEFGLEAAQQRAGDTGLLLAYEKSGYDNTEGGRIPILLHNWTVRQLKEKGANCIKLLIYYTPLAEDWINESKHSFVERIGAECAHHDIPFFLEFVGYDVEGLSPLEYARKKPEIVAGSMEEFSKEIYNVDVLKVEIPVDLKFTSGTESFQGGEAAYSKEEAKDLYHRAAAVARRPFIYLSAGVTDAQFRESLELAIDADVNFAGVLCGRATWQEGIPVFAKQGRAALEDWLSDRGVKNIQALNQVLEGARAWKDFYQGELETA